MIERYIPTKSECLYELRELLNDTADENNAYHFWHEYSYQFKASCKCCEYHTDSMFCVSIHRRLRKVIKMSKSYVNKLKMFLTNIQDNKIMWKFWHDYSFHMFTTCNECPCSVRFNDTECAWVEGDMYMIARYLV